MKKIIFPIILLLTFVLAMPLASAFSLDAYFQNGQTSETINPGQTAGYYIDVIPNSYGKTLDIEVRLYDDTRTKLADKGIIYKEQFEIPPGHFYYSPVLSIKPSHYELPGEYFAEVKVTQTSTHGTTQIQTKQLYLTVTGERKLVADFTYSPSNPTTDDVVTFTSTSTVQGNQIVKEEWFVDNKKIGEGKTIEHQFKQKGSYQVRLTVHDDASQTASKTRTVTVTEVVPPKGPMADFTFSPSKPTEEHTVVFTSTSTAGDNPIVKLEWFVGSQKIGEGANAKKRFSPGTHHVTLKVTDSTGLSDSKSRSITVLEKVYKPIASFTHAPEQPLVGQTVTFTSTSDPGKNRQIAIEEWRIDGNLVWEGSSFKHVFTSPGTYGVKLTTRNDMGFFDSAEKIIVVKPAPKGPEASFTFTPANPTTKDMVKFTSTSKAGDNPIVKYEWFIDHQEAGGSTVTYRRFEDPGAYSVKLVVTDSKGLKDSVTRTVIVSEHIPPKGPMADFTFSPSKPTEEHTVVFTSTSTAGDHPIVKLEWFVGSQKIGEGATLHRKFDPGTHHITLKVTDSIGKSGSKTRTVTVTEVVPPKGPMADFTFSPSKPTEEHTVVFTSTSTAGDHPIVKLEWFVDNQKVGEGQTLQRKFLPGSYKVTLKVMDSKGLTNSRTRTVVVVEKPVVKGPMADFKFSPDKPFVGEEVSFTSTSKAGDHPIVKLEWFVDSQKVGEGHSIKRVFDKSGSYKVTLKVMDSNGLTNSRTRIVTVQQRQLVLDELSANKDVVKGYQQHFAAHVSDALGNDVEGAEVTYKLSHNNQVLGSCNTNFKGYCNINPVINLAPGNYEVYAEARKPGYLPDLSKKLRASFKVWEKRYEVKLLTLYEDEFVTENYTFYRGTPIYASFRIKDTFTNAYVHPDSGLVEEVFLRVHNVEPLYFDVFKPVHPEEHRYFHKKIPLTDDFLGEGKVFAFVFNFKDGTAGQDSVTVNVLNNPLNFFPPEEFRLKAGSHVDIDFKKYVEDRETPPDKIIITHGDTGLMEVSGLGNNVFRVKAPQSFEGSEVIIFTADDTDGSKVSRPIKFVVSKVEPPKKPVADFVVEPEKPVEGQRFMLRSTSKEGDHPIVKFEWFVDNKKIGEGESFRHRIMEAGSYEIMLRVTDSKGLLDEKLRVVVVKKDDFPEGPKADFTFTPSTPVVSESVVFTSTSEEGDHPIVKYEWFKNEVKVGEGFPNHHHVFSDAGSFLFALKVTDSKGLSDVRERMVVVSEGVAENPVAVLKVPGSTIVNETVKLDASDSFDPQGKDIISYEWIVTRFGVTLDNFTSSAPVVDYSFGEQGRYNIHLTVRTIDNRVGSTVAETFAGRRYGGLVDPVDGRNRVDVVNFHVYGSDFGVLHIDDFYAVKASFSMPSYGREINGLRMTFSIPELGIQQRGTSFTLRPGRTEHRSITGFISEYDMIPPGDYYALIGVTGPGISRSKYYPIIIE